jgi:regulator of protease activity HflC (stomatin/prohibitin superfamily)
MPVVFGILIAVLILLLITSFKSFGINQEYQRGVLFRLGRLGPMKGPGWYWLIPFVDRVVRVDQRIITYQLETQETITRDGVAVRVNAVLWFRAESPIQVVTAVEDWISATVRDAIGQSDLDLMLKDRASINHRLQQLLRDASLKWGVEIDSVEIKDVDIPEQMQRAIAKEAEAIREKRARIIRAEGEQEAAAKLTQAAETIGSAPAALELRRLQTLSEIGVEHNTTIVAMLPVELVHAARKLAGMPEASSE